jgi:hypothetical protein
MSRFSSYLLYEAEKLWANSQLKHKAVLSRRRAIQRALQAAKTLCAVSKKYESSKNSIHQIEIYISYLAIEEMTLFEAPTQPHQAQQIERLISDLKALKERSSWRSQRDEICHFIDVKIQALVDLLRSCPTLIHQDEEASPGMADDTYEISEDVTALLNISKLNTKIATCYQVGTLSLETLIQQQTKMTARSYQEHAWKASGSFRKIKRVMTFSCAIFRQNIE